MNNNCNNHDINIVNEHDEICKSHTPHSQPCDCISMGSNYIYTNYVYVAYVVKEVESFWRRGLVN